MDDEKLKAIQTFLLAHGSSIESLSKGRLEQFSKVYDAVTEKKAILADLKCKISENSISVLSISNATGISRKTFYNNELLKVFVEEAASSAEAASFTKDNREYIEQIDILNERIRLLMLRDIEEEKLHHKIAELSREIIEKDNRIRNIEKEYESVRAELAAAKRFIPQKTAEIIEIPKRDK